MSNLSASVSRKFARLVATLICLLWMVSGSVAWAASITCNFENPSSNNIVVVTDSGYSSSSVPEVSTSNYFEGVMYSAGYSENNQVSNNSITVKNGTFSSVDGGDSINGDVVNNVVTIEGGNHTQIYGGITSNGNAINNVVNISGGSVDNYSELDYRAYTLSAVTGASSSGGNATSNIINISGGTIKGNVFAGVAGSGNTVANNTINVYGNPNLSLARLVGASVWGNKGSVGDTYGNTLNIYTKNIDVEAVGEFENINFYLPESTVNGDTILNVTDANLSGTVVKAGVQGNANLSTGDSVTLIKSSNAIEDANTTYGTLTEGVSLNYDLTVEKADANTVVAHIGSVTSDPNGYSTPISSAATATAAVSSNNGTRLLEQTSILPMPTLAAPAMVSHHIESTINWLPPIDDFGGNLDVISTEGSGDDGEITTDGDESAESLEGGKHAGVSGYNIFANMGYSSMRTKTGNGSQMDTKSGGFDIGASRAFETGNSVIHFAPIFDYGTGSYDSYMGNGIHGSGNAKFYMGGVIARQTFDNGFYYEGSFRYGKATLDFSSDDLRYKDQPVSYDASAPCWAAHAKVGLRYKVDDDNVLDLYGIYFHTRQGAMEADLSSGETYRFDGVTNYRFRAGARLTRRVNDHSRFYSGLAYEYTHDGAARGTYLARGLTTEESGSKGSSVMVELGWQYKPTKDNPWMVDVNATGSFGHNRGFAIQAKMKKEF